MTGELSKLFDENYDNPAVCLELLDQAQSCREAEAAPAVMTLLDHPDYLVRSKAFAVLGEIGCPRIIPDLLAFLEKEKEEEWRLRCLEVLHLIGAKESVPRLLDFLTDSDPVFLRGLVWCLGSIGGRQAVEGLLRFAASPRGRIIRPDIVAESLGMALEKTEGGQQLLERLAAEDKRIALYLRSLRLRGREEARYSVYPAADYLRQKVAAQGIDYRNFKRMVF